MLNFIFVGLLTGHSMEPKLNLTLFLGLTKSSNGRHFVWGETYGNKKTFHAKWRIILDLLGQKAEVDMIYKISPLPT